MLDSFGTINIIIVILEAIAITGVGLYFSNRLMRNKLVGLYAEINRQSLELKNADIRLQAEMRNRDMLLSSLETKMSKLYDCLGEIEKLRLLLLQDKMVVAESEIDKNKDIHLLGIWPIISELPDLAINEEIELLFKSVYTYTKLHSDAVSRSAIVNELDKNPNINLIHFGGHSSNDGFALNNGGITIDIVGPEWFGRIAKTYPIKVCVLASCSSLQIVDTLYESGVNAVLGFRDDINDDEVIRFLTFFYKFLASGKSVTSSANLSLLAVRTDLAQSIVVRGDYKFE